VLLLLTQDPAEDIAERAHEKKETQNRGCGHALALRLGQAWPHAFGGPAASDEPDWCRYRCTANCEDWMFTYERIGQGDSSDEQRDDKCQQPSERSRLRPVRQGCHVA